MADFALRCAARDGRAVRERHLAAVLLLIWCQHCRKRLRTGLAPLALPAAVALRANADEIADLEAVGCRFGANASHFADNLVPAHARREDGAKVPAKTRYVGTAQPTVEDFD